MEFLNGDIREHTDVDCILHVDTASDTACNIHIIDHAHIEVQRSKHCTDC